ncbi:MAG: hypothetical protein ACSHX8_03805 [Opitutaceae bacterium]
MDKAITEARCKIIWGDEPESVKAFLQEKNLSNEQADGVVQTLLEERHSTVKKNGIRKLSKALILLIILGALLYLQLVNADQLSAYQIRKFSGAALGLTVAGFLWNLWIGTDALFEILNPTKFEGDVGFNAD